MVMKTHCPKCGEEIEKTIESARNHVRHKHPKLTDNAKIILRDKICKFQPTGGFGQSRSVLENQLTKQLDIK